ncbi:MAG: hypothetical protein H6898_08675 [Rhodobacter sp.]|nr:hypothetical protein [Paracoccaceae bacterium]MCC0076649.1 hypothetical protein [Rhodobacter sp.]
MNPKPGLLLLLLAPAALGWGPALAQTNGPLSAIDWLRQSAVSPEPGAYPVTPPSLAGGGNGISVRALDALRPEAVGLYPAARVGLPATLWGPTSAGTLAELIEALPADMLPSLRDRTLHLLLAEFNAPLPEPGLDGVARPDFLLARVDKLVEFGALDHAAAVLDALGSSDPLLRLRRFDIGLLLGDEHQACIGVLIDQPPVGDDAATVFCLARDGRWQEASDLLDQAALSGSISAYESDLLTHFVHGDERLPGASSLLPPPTGTPSPLVWRLLEAAGDPVSTLGLPVAFAHADLRGTIGWRAQLEAAERLVRVGALSPNRLLGLYTERRAAASGGIWERVRAVQALDEAIHSGDPAAAGAALLDAWPLIQAGELEVAMANLYALPLRQLALTGEAGDLAFRIGLLSEDYETVALALPANAPGEARFLAAVARGLDPALAGSMPGELAPAVALAFGPTPPEPEGLRDRLAQGRLGEEILRVLAQLGGPGDPRMLAEGLTTLRILGLEDTARRTALESLLLERHG